MKKEQIPQTRIDDILQSLDGIQRAEPQPFFYTRLQAKLDVPDETNNWRWLSKPAFSFATLLLLLVLNIAMISSYLGAKKADASPTTSNIESFAKEYNLDGSSSYTDKPEP